MADESQRARMMELAQQVAKLQDKLNKQQKINRVLMSRVERSMDAQGDAFSLFQTAISLEAKLKERTVRLQRAMQVPAALITALNGLVVVFVVSSEIFSRRLNRARRLGVETPAATESRAGWEPTPPAARKAGYPPGH